MSGVRADSTDGERGDTMPENLPTDESIKKLENAEKKRLVAPKKKKTAKHSITKSLTQELLCLAGGAGRGVSSATE